MLMFKINPMKKYNLKNLSQLFLLVLITCSCTKAVIPASDGIDTSIKITYTKDVQPLIFNNCLTCHSNVNPRAGLVLTTYQQVRTSAESGSLIIRMNSSSNPMPPNGKLIQHSLDIIDKWKADGFIEN